MKAIGLFALAIGLLFGSYAPGLASKILVSPGSIVFDDKTHAAQLIVANIDDKTMVYRLQPTFFTMQEDGSLVETAGEAPANGALALVRFSPRQFELKPGESQVVRIATRVPASLAKGEYRMHLRVVNLGEAMAAPVLLKPNTLDAQISILVTRAVRILVRNGVTGGRASLGDISARRLKSGRIAISFDLHRAGEGSSRGEYAIFAQNHDTGAKVADLVDRGVLIYADLATRRLSETVPGAALKGGSEICVAYRDEMAAEGGEKQCVAVSAS